MWGAAPRRCRYRLLVLVAFLVGLSAAPAAARVDLGAQHVASPTELWVIGVDRHNVAALTDRFALRARRARVNALVIDRRGLTRRQSTRVQRLVKRFGFRAIVLPRATTMSSSCAAGRQTDSTALCTLRAGSLSSARRLASSPNVDLVVVRLKHLPSTASVKAIGDVHATVLVLVEIGRRRSLNRNAWQKVIREAAGERSFVLGVVPVASDRVRALDAYVGLLGKTATPPSEPDGLVLASASRNSLRVQWTRVNSVSKYGVYRDSGLVKSVSTNSATLSGLACGTGYLVRGRCRGQGRQALGEGVPAGENDRLRGRVPADEPLGACGFGRNRFVAHALLERVARRRRRHRIRGLQGLGIRGLDAMDVVHLDRARLRDELHACGGRL